MTGGNAVRAHRNRAAAACALAVHAAPGTLALYVVLSIASGGAPVATAWLTKRALDTVAGRGGAGSVLVPGVGLAAMGLVAGSVPTIARFLQTRLDRRVGLRAQDRLFGAVEAFTGLGRFEDPAFLDRLRLAQQAGSQTAGQVVDGLVGAARSTLTIAGFLGSLLMLSPVMTGLVAAASVPVLVSEIKLARQRARMSWDIGPAERREFLFADLLSSVEAAKEVRLFGTGPFFRHRMLTERAVANAAKDTVDRRELHVQSALGLLSTLVSGGGLLWAVEAARTGALSVGGVTMFIAAVAGVQGTLASLAGQVSSSYQALLLFDHYVAVVGAEPDLPLASQPRPVPALREGIELRDVWFRYCDDQPWVLCGVTLHIPKGAAVALVGLNGAGKSTLVKLLCRFYDPTRGAILWDGVDLRDIHPVHLRRRISAVFQDYMDYDMTVTENIALGDLRRGGDANLIREAARKAGVHDTVEALPNGYETLLTRTFFMQSDNDDPRNGVVLSGGQWQRLALARALLRGPRDLMILDEPSAGLDAAAEQQIHATLRRHRAGRTSLLISHRLSAAREADLIIVLADGRVVEHGDHSELVAAGGRYARLFALQADGYRPREVVDGDAALGASEVERI